MSWRKTLQQSDASAVGTLVQETGFFSEEETQVAIELVEETLTRGSASGYEFVFADAPGNTGKLLAYACFGPVPATRSSYDLYWIAVTPVQQGKGLGGQLLQEVERCALESGATQMYLDTSGRPQYAPTRAFYLSQGYQVAATLKDFFAPGDDKVMFVKYLQER
jgi:GNAT superfamily N-acetyltransferase